MVGPGNLFRLGVHLRVPPPAMGQTSVFPDLCQSTNEHNRHPSRSPVLSRSHYHIYRWVFGHAILAIGPASSSLQVWTPFYPAATHHWWAAKVCVAPRVGLPDAYVGPRHVWDRHVYGRAGQLERDTAMLRSAGWQLLPVRVNSTVILVGDRNAHNRLVRRRISHHRRWPLRSGDGYGCRYCVRCTPNHCARGPVRRSLR